MGPSSCPLPSFPIQEPTNHAETRRRSDAGREHCRHDIRGARIIEFLSKHEQFGPGDLIATGSPAGNGTHYNRFLKPEHVMELDPGLGMQRNPCIAGEGDGHVAR